MATTATDWQGSISGQSMPLIESSSFSPPSTVFLPPQMDLLQRPLLPSSSTSMVTSSVAAGPIAADSAFSPSGTRGTGPVVEILYQVTVPLLSSGVYARELVVLPGDSGAPVTSTVSADGSSVLIGLVQGFNSEAIREGYICPAPLALAQVRALMQDEHAQLCDSSPSCADVICSLVQSMMTWIASATRRVGALAAAV
jgi:hypothetical protein